MAYTTINKSGDYFNTKLYTGNGSTQSITGVGFQPDWVWGKARSEASNHMLFDIVRGTGKELHSQNTDIETTSATTLTAFDSDGFSLGNNGNINRNTETYASWNWLTDNTSGSSNTDGSITSTVSANTTAGFSIVSWTGNSGTVGHGLGVKPAMIIVKSRQSTTNWVVMHKGLGNMDTNILVLNTTTGIDSGGAGMAEPTTSVFTITSGLAPNDNLIAYCFAEKKGYSKFGSYTGNGSTDGTFIYTGFKPTFVNIKRTDSAGQWNMFDIARADVPNANGNDQVIYSNSSDAELSSVTREIDLLSNGFKCRNTGGDINASGGSYIYMAFGQSLVGSNNVPANAR